MSLNSHRPPAPASPFAQAPDLSAQARALDIDPAGLSDAELRIRIKAERERRWKIEYADFIVAYNEMVERDGLPLAEWREF